MGSQSFWTNYNLHCIYLAYIVYTTSPLLVSRGINLSCSFTRDFFIYNYLQEFIYRWLIIETLHHLQIVYSIKLEVTLFSNIQSQLNLNPRHYELISCMRHKSHTHYPFCFSPDQNWTHNRCRHIHQSPM